MKDNLNYQQVPATMEQDLNREFTKWCNGRLVSMDCGSYTLVYLGHHESVDEEGNAVVLAWPVVVDDVVSKAHVINAAEMQAYGLTTAMEVASFAASLARKSRICNSDEEVRIHDEFINWVKDEVKKNGMFCELSFDV